MSSATKTLTFNSKEELDKWLKENEGKTNFVVRDSSGRKIMEGRKNNNVVADILWDTFATPIAITGLGISDFLARSAQNMGIDTKGWQDWNKQKLGQVAPISLVEAYEKDPLGTWGWNAADTALTFLPGIGQAAKGVKAVGAIAKLANFADKVKDIGAAGKAAGAAIRGAAKGLELAGSAASKAPKINPLLSGAIGGAVSYTASEAPEDRTLGGYATSIGLGAALPWAVSKLPVVRNAAPVADSKPAPKTGLTGLVTSIPEDWATDIFAERILRGGKDFKVPIDPNTGVPVQPQKGLKAGLLDFMATEPKFNDLTPKTDAKYRLAATQTLYDILSKEAGKPIEFGIQNDEIILNALNKAKGRIMSEFGDKKTVAAEKLLDDLKQFVNTDAVYKKYKSELGESVSWIPGSWDELLEREPKRAKELMIEALDKNLGRLTHAKVSGTAVSDLWDSVKKGKAVTLSQIDNAIKELNEIIFSGKAKTAQKLVAEKLKGILDGYRETLMPGLKEWDRIWAGISEFVGNKRGGLENRAIEYWGNPIGFLKAAARKSTEPLYNAMQSIDAFMNKLRGVGSPDSENYLQNIVKSVVRPMARDIPVYMDNQSDKVLKEGAAASPAINVAKMLDEEERALEEQAQAQLQQAYAQRRRELEAARIAIFQDALNRGMSVSNAEKLANFYVENELKAIDNAMKKARLTVEEQKQKLRAHLGMKGVEVIKELAKDPETVNMITLYHALTPGHLNVLRPPEVQLFEQAVLQITEAMSRSLSGAAIKEDEMERFMRMVPRFGDTKETLEYKLKALESFFNETLPELERQKNASLVIGDTGIDRDTLLENRDIILDNIK